MASGRFVLLLAVLPVLVTKVSPAQQAPTASGIPVHMVITAQAPHSYSPPSISREDVMVYEGRDRDKVTDWLAAEGDRARLELFVFIDDSSNASLGSQLEDLRHFIDAQPSTTTVGVAYMENGGAHVVQNLTDDHAQAAKALRLPRGIPGENASPYFALQDLLKRWPEPALNARREIVMVSDGIDAFWGSGPDDPYVSEAIEQAQRARVLIFSIYTPGAGFYAQNSWRTWWGQMYLSRVAAETGGESYYIGFNGAPVSFVPYLDQISHRLSHQYFLTFLAKPQKKAGVRRVKVTTEVPNVELVGADNVYVPAGPE